MKRHVLHPLWVAIGVVGLILFARLLLVPDDFGVHGDSFTYNYHRLGNIEEWKNFPVKYQGTGTCLECHKDNARTHRRSPHKRVQCENCHGPAGNHPDDVEFLPLNKERAMCLRCHADLRYPESTARSNLPAIVDRHHKRRRECVSCHDPHDPREDVE
ncbi:MAG: nitrate reductase cytochrome c-type subunit [Gammaproteobacteria bacterium]|nr:nitrate reductase cytochrome c-type subunit [Gammaproteobacteria bacterium]